MIKVKRVYEPPSEDDGERYLVERLWPRGVSREVASLTGWLTGLAPSPGLRQWFGHDPLRRDEFRQRYETELNMSERQPLLQELAERTQKGTITLVFSTRDTQHNSAVVVKAFLEKHYPY